MKPHLTPGELEDMLNEAVQDPTVGADRYARIARLAIESYATLFVAAEGVADEAIAYIEDRAPGEAIVLLNGFLYALGGDGDES